SGSPAFRSQFVQGEITAASAGLTVANGFAAGTVPGQGTYKAAFSAKDTYTVIHGVDVDHNEIAYINQWTCSIAGLFDLAQANLIAYIPVANIPAINATTVTLPTTETAAPLLAMADC